MKILRTANLRSNFTGPYKKIVKVIKKQKVKNKTIIKLFSSLDTKRPSLTVAWLSGHL